ncbi:regulating synaptic membrane exocytosis protein 1 isoform X2 [Athalia rosae]|uniref:regulating synaptic membrane exocytosis protein 1 isoform X2 n=1 Tax=Athalia rosae TaxID=37344 RepID=UPI002034368F|nr:regulating synaptic membrane exocytosis protein 1 isoform X2 [Athalia rosae]
MLPTNVMSFMKKMVTTQPDAGPAGSVTPEESGTTFSKLRQLGSGLMTATGNVTKLTPAKVTPVEEIQPKQETSPVEQPKPKPEPGRPASRTGACRVCLKSFKPDDFSRTCNECQHKVCEDCASYSTTAETDDASTWRCSVCRRKIASRGQPVVTQESTDSLLDVPVLEALQRRHSDARLGCQAGNHTGGLTSGLAPPRSPELRRHSDVSPASLKELEKVAGERCEELRWERELEWRSKSRGGSPERHHCDGRGDRNSERNERNEQSAERGDRGERNDRGDRVRANSPPHRGSKQNSSAADQDHAGDQGNGGGGGGGGGDEDEERWRRSRRTGGTVRRKSRVARQRSYDEEVKSGAMSGSGQPSHPEPGLNLPVQLPRRASAYDVYATPGASGLNAMAIAAAQQRASMFAQGNREPEERSVQTSRRSSFRAVKPVLPYDMGTEEEKVINLDTSPTTEPSNAQSPALAPDEDRRTRRRGSQLPDLNAIRGLPVVPGVSKGPVTNVQVRATAAVDDRELPRQGSLADGEGIKIVIHDVDSDMVPRVNSKRRVVLRRDPVMDKGHRTRGFGMRVVGGKTGSDGRMFASIVWTVPGGPAEKAGLQQGDKVLEWGTVSLIDRSFEEVAQIMERTGDVAELVVEHTTDLIGDLDDPGMVQNPGKPAGGLGLQLETDTDKTPSSPTRRKLPKTPEQIAKERQVTGRVQIQVWYEAERKELVISVLAGDELCTREDTGYGTAPEAYAKLRLVPACGDQSSLKTDVAEPTQNPIWNATLNFSGVPGDELMDKSIEVTLWDYCPDRESVFMGECTVDLQKAFLDDRAVWYRLEDPRCLRYGKSPHCSPRGSLSTEIAQRLLRRTDFRERSISDDTPSDGGSPEPYFLHPDHAWQANSRRGSSQSEQLEVEPYELNKDYSRSLPGSRRSSFQSQGGTDSKRGSTGEADVPVVVYNRDRRRSSCARVMRDPDEILRSLKAVKGELGRTMSLSSNDKRRGSRRGERKDSVLDIPEKLFDRNSESDDDDKWSQSAKDDEGFDVKLGPGQVAPRGFKLTGGVPNGEVKLGLFMGKETLEVEVICARGICPGERIEPDTYVKTYLRDGERWLQKRKTRVVRHSREPQYRQTLKYGSCDAKEKNLLVMLWERNMGFESNQGLGGAEVNLGLLTLTRLTVGWYPLFPIHTLGTQNADSP